MIKQTLLSRFIFDSRVIRVAKVSSVNVEKNYYILDETRVKISDGQPINNIAVVLHVALVKTGRSMDLNESVSGIANNYRFNCDKKKKKRKEKSGKTRIAPMFSHRSRAKFVDIVTLTVAESEPPPPSNILVINRPFKQPMQNSVGQKSCKRGKQNNFWAEGRSQSFFRVSNFRLFAGFRCSVERSIFS